MMVNAKKWQQLRAHCFVSTALERVNPYITVGKTGFDTRLSQTKFYIMNKSTKQSEVRSTTTVM